MFFGDVRKSTFKGSFERIKNHLKQYIYNSKCDVEIVAALIVVYDFAIFIKGGNRYRQRMANIIIPYAAKLADTNSEYLQKRMDFYGEFIRGKQPRCDFCFGNNKDTGNPLLRVTMAFADVIFNTDLIDDYDNGAMLLGDIFESVNYTTLIQEKVSPEIRNAFNNATNHLW